MTQATGQRVALAALDVIAADHTARHWTWPVQGPLPIGNDAHRDAACGMVHDTFNPHRPSIIDWPKLSPDALARLTGLSIWDIAVQTEGKARPRMTAYGKSFADPAWRAAIERNAWEKGAQRRDVEPGRRIWHPARTDRHRSWRWCRKR